MKARAILAMLLVATTLFVGCGSKNEGAGQETNGTATEQTTGFNGEKSAESVSEKGDTTISTVTFENGKPVAVKLEVKLADGTLKTEASANGTYDMKNDGLKWHEQAAELEKFIVENNFDLSKVTLTNDKGNTDAVTGVTIKVGEYLNLTEAALAKVDANGQEVVEAGFTGDKTAESVSEKGDTTMATVGFENGTPKSVKIEVKLADGSLKTEASANGTYDMKNDGLKWHEQVAELEKFIVENNFDLTKVTLTTDAGNTDAVTGVTIKVGEYVNLVQEALDQAK